jgi:hypothetical protein
LTPPPRFTFFQCRGEDLFAFSHDITGANIPRSPCTQGWIFCEQFELGPGARSSSNNGRANPEGDRKQRILRLAWLERFIRPAEPPARLTEGNICHRPEAHVAVGNNGLTLRSALLLAHETSQLSFNRGIKKQPQALFSRAAPSAESQQS